MYHILPKTELLDEFFKAMRLNSKSKKQQDVAERIIKEYEDLKEYSQEITKKANHQTTDEGDPDMPPDHLSIWSMMG